VGKASECLSSANDLLIIIDTLLGLIERGGQLLNEGVPRPCHICGNGYYRPQVLRQGTNGGILRIWVSGGATDIESMPVQILACDNCRHVEFFRT
jgi:hypothetical protein